MRNFFIFVALLVCGGLWFKNFVSSGRMLAYLDAHPHQRGTCTALFGMARFYEVFSEDKKALEAYERVAERYPNSRYAVDAAFGAAVSLEHLKRYKDALRKYEEFLEKHPNTKYTESVRNNIDILKSR